MVELTLTGKPPGGATHWTTRTLAAQVGVGKDTVAQIWADHQLKPWKVDVFKLSNDPEFESKLVDVVGLYLNPPARAVVFSFDEKTQCQALDRTQPSLPMKPGRAGTMTHDYKRHGTIDLFAAMNVGTGAGAHPPAQGPRRRRTCWRSSNRSTPPSPRGLSVHVILDNLSAHKTPEIREMVGAQGPPPLASALHPDLEFLAQPDRTLVQGTDRQTPAPRRVHLRRRPHRRRSPIWAEHWNTDPKPFIWKATAEDIIDKVSRGRETLHQIKSATDH